MGYMHICVRYLENMCGIPMKKFTINSLLAIMAVFVLFAGMDDAQARRFGGGKSFGGKSSYGSPFRRSPTRAAKSPSQQQAAAHNQSARSAMSKRGGLMGMLGGLALGGLLGSLLFGGAFENFNMFDILVFALIAFVLYKIFAARSPRPSYQNGASGGFYDDAEERQPGFGNQRRAFETDVMFDKDKPATNHSTALADDADFSETAIPDDFDQTHFLDGAKAAYTQLQRAWDNGELAEIRGLTTDKVFAEIQDQFREQDGGNRTEILKLDAELLDVREIGSEMEATVMFDAIMRESELERPEQVREIWHFIKPINSRTPKWLLDGIQQLAD